MEVGHHAAQGATHYGGWTFRQPEVRIRFVLDREDGVAHALLLWRYVTF